MVVVDKLSKVAHFIPVKTTHKVANIADIYMKEVSKLHGVPKAIVSNKDPKFTSNFWKRLSKGFGTNLNLSTSYHPKSGEQTERTNKIIEDMLRMHVMDQRSKWEVVTIDFIKKLPKTMKQHDSIMVVVDKLTKAAHFIPMKTTHKVTNIA